MTKEKFEHAQEIQEELSQCYDMLWLIENYHACVRDEKLCAGEIMYIRDGKDINTSNPPEGLCIEIIDVIKHYISKLDEEFKNL